MVQLPEDSIQWQSTEASEGLSAGRVRKWLLPTWLDRRYLVFTLLVLIIMVTFLAHLGIDSPYSYVWQVLNPTVPYTTKVEGIHENQDVPKGYKLMTGFFYQPVSNPSEYANTQGIVMPFPQFFIAVFIGLTRSFTFSGYLVNILFMLLLAWAFIKLNEILGVPLAAVALSGCILLLLPFFAHYLGQPMQYIPSAAISFLIVMAIIGLAAKDYKNPIGLGLLAGLIAINFDWYVFLGALILFFLMFYPLEKRRHYLYLFAAMALPCLTWYAFIMVSKHIGVSQKGISYMESFLTPVIRGWFAFLKHPAGRFSLPLNASDIGLTVALKQILAYIYWPLLLFTVFFIVILLVNRPNNSKKGSPAARLAILLLLVYVAEQIMTGFFDWENNARRAIPIILAFSIAFVYVVWKTMDRRWVKSFLILLLAMCLIFTFTDFLLKDPWIQMRQSPQFIQGGPNERAKTETISNIRLTRQSIPALPKDGRLQFFKVQKARVSPGCIWLFVATQMFLAACAAALFYFLNKAGILPRFCIWIFCAIFGLSMVMRFI